MILTKAEVAFGVTQFDALQAAGDEKHCGW
jgi:hypothetical protein